MSNLLEKASIILTPTAYNNGEALCVKPSDGSGDFDFSRNSAATRVNAQGLVENVQILSSNLVQNGDFSEEGVQEITNGDFSNGSTGWSVGTGITISSQANFTSVSGSYITQNILTAGKTYKLTFNITEYTSGTLIVFGGAGNNIVSSLSLNAVGSYTTYFVAGGFDSKIYFGNVFTGSITNISVKEVGQNWDLGTGWSIGNNKAILTNGTDSTYQIFQGISGLNTKRLKVTFDISNFSGSAEIRYPLRHNITANGSYSFEGIGDFDRLQFQAKSGATTSFDITNISVIEITDDTNLPRINYEGFSYDGSGNVVPNSGCGSWLFEPQSTNLVTYSEDINSWSKAGLVTISSNNATSPEGVQNASLILPNAGSGSFGVINSISKSSSLITYTLSGFAKEKDYNFLILRIDSGAANGVKGAFDLSNGTISTAFSTNGTGFTFIDAYIKPYTNNWYKYEVSFTTDSTTLLRTIFYVSDITGNGFSVPSYTANGTDGVLFWGAQLEEGSYATSYIPTSGSQVTRNQDLCNNGGSLASINSTSGTLYFEGAALSNDLTDRDISISDGTNNNVVRIRFSRFSNNIGYAVLSNGVTTVGALVSGQTQTNTNKIAVKYKQDDFALWVNGVEVATDTSGNTPIGLSSLQFTTGNVALPFFGKTKALAVFPYLSDAELTELTTI